MKTCKDFEYTGIECCIGCHAEAEMEDEPRPMISIQINGEMAVVCCHLADFFYPNFSWKDGGREGKRGQGNGNSKASN